MLSRISQRELGIEHLAQQRLGNTRKRCIAEYGAVGIALVRQRRPVVKQTGHFCAHLGLELSRGVRAVIARALTEGFDNPIELGPLMLRLSRGDERCER